MHSHLSTKTSLLKLLLFFSHKCCYYCFFPLYLNRADSIFPVNWVIINKQTKGSVSDTWKQFNIHTPLPSQEVLSHILLSAFGNKQWLSPVQRFQVCSHRHSSPVGWIARFLEAWWDNALHSLSSVQKQWHPHPQGSSDKGHGSQTQRGTDKTTAESQKKTTERYVKEWGVRKKGKPTCNTQDFKQ